MTVGVTAGSALAGTAVDAWGARPAFAVPCVAAGVAALLAVAGTPWLRDQPPGGFPAGTTAGDAGARPAEPSAGTPAGGAR
jgi:hypothetical protein